MTLGGGIYNPNKDFSQILNEIHDRILVKMKLKTYKKEAQELQTILQELKQVAHDFDNVTDSVIGLDLKNEFKDIIDLAYQLQMDTGVHGKGLKASTLFRREHGTSTIKEANDIFEEDLAAVLAAGEILGSGNKDIEIRQFLFGTTPTGTRATKAYNLIGDLDESVEKLIKTLADKENKKASTQIRRASGKIDIHGKSITLNYSKRIPFKVERLMQLMKDATLSVKNYKSYNFTQDIYKDLSDIGIRLGNSNLYKAVTGALSEIQLGHKQQLAFFCRGMNTMIGNTHGYGDITKQHFSHLRFMYELRGSGLLDENNRVMPVKFIIYNDPNSDNIYVRDTASIILEALQNSKNNLFGEISIPASVISNT